MTILLTYSTLKGIHSYDIRGWIYLLLYFLVHPTQKWWYNRPRKANIFYRIKEHLVLNRISSLSILDFWEFNSGQISIHLLNTYCIRGTTWNTRSARIDKLWSLPSRSSQSLKNTNVPEWHHHVLSGKAKSQARASFQVSILQKFNFLFIPPKLTFSFLHPCWDSLKGL